MGTEAKISCNNVWKIFGPDPKTVLSSSDKDMSRAEVQEKTGHVIAVKDVSFSIQKGETFLSRLMISFHSHLMLV